MTSFVCLWGGTKEDKGLILSPLSVQVEVSCIPHSPVKHSIPQHQPYLFESKVASSGSCSMHFVRYSMAFLGSSSANAALAMS